MPNKGLCLTCIYDKTCVFLRRFPVLHCEEFNDEGLNGKSKPKKQGSCVGASRITAYIQEESIAE